MKKLRRVVAAAAFATAGTIVWPGAAAPAGAHAISCYTPGDLSEFGSYMECQARASVHQKEHDVNAYVWIVYCYYEYLNNRPCF